MKVTSVENAEHYIWGDNCDGWHLVKSEKLSVIKERMPSGCSEVRHLHKVAEQFFFVLDGIATIETDTNIFHLHPKQGLHIPPNTFHQVRNEQDNDLLFTVTSTPPTKGDRFEQPRV